MITTVMAGLLMYSAITGENTEDKRETMFVIANIAPFSKVGK